MLINEVDRFTDRGDFLGVLIADLHMELLFERFLSESRNEWPDIDLDLPSEDKRELAIQYVYQRYGELGAAMTANVITYRGKSAIREVGKALGLSLDMVGTLANNLYGWSNKPIDEERVREIGLDPTDRRLALALHLAREVGIELPITEQVAAVLFERRDPRQAVTELMGRQGCSE